MIFRESSQNSKEDNVERSLQIRQRNVELSTPSRHNVVGGEVQSAGNNGKAPRSLGVKIVRVLHLSTADSCGVFEICGGDALYATLFAGRGGGGGGVGGDALCDTLYEYAGDIKVSRISNEKILREENCSPNPRLFRGRAVPFPAAPLFFCALTLLCRYFSTHLPCCALNFPRTQLVTVPLIFFFELTLLRTYPALRSPLTLL